jgi:hypothetical protein
MELVVLSSETFKLIPIEYASRRGLDSTNGSRVKMNVLLTCHDVVEKAL